MKTMFRTAGSVLAMTLAMAGVAFAAPMTGHYVGLGTVDGSVIDVVQNGSQITATFAGVDVGELNAQQTGDNTAAGILHLIGYGRYNFESQLQDDILSFLVYGADGPVTFEFQRTDEQTADVANNTNAPTSEKPSYYYTVDGGQNGPVTLADLRSLVDDGTVSATTLVWAKGDKAWVAATEISQIADALPPPTPATEQYYVAVDGERQGPIGFDQVVALIDDAQATKDTLAWTKEQDDWVSLASFEEFSDALTSPPPLPEIADVVPPALPVNIEPPALPSSKDAIAAEADVTGGPIVPAPESAL